MSTVPKRLLILSDGRAGHVSTARGMAELVRDEGPYDIQTLEVRLRVKFLRPLLKWLLNSGLAGRWMKSGRTPRWPRLFYHGYVLPPYDAVLSAGGDTLYLNALMGHCTNRPNIFCGSLRGVHPEFFDLIVHIRGSDLPNWIAMEVLPSSAQIGAAAEAAGAFARLRLNGQETGFWALLIGGRGSGYRYTPDEILALVRDCALMAEQQGKSLLITTSRRTGKTTERRIRAWLDNQPRPPVAYAVLYNHAPERVATTFMALSEAVFCTEDSLSMISEAVLLQRPLVTLVPEDARPNRDHLDFLQRLAEKKRLFRAPLAGIAKLDVTAIQDSWQAYDRADHGRLRNRMTETLRGPHSDHEDSHAPHCHL